MSATVQTSSHHAAEEARENRMRIIGGLGGAALGIGLRLLPTPHGLSGVGHSILAILAMTVVFWIFEVFGNAVSAILMIGLMIIAGVKPAHALAIFSELSFWILLVVLFYGYAMQSTGLAKRLSYLILSWFPPTYGGVLASFFVIGAVLSLCVPSMTVRTAIMTPVAWALVQALGIEPKSRESSLIMLSCVEMSVLPGMGTLLGSLWGPLMIKLYSQQHMPELQWMAWFKAMALPTFVMCVMVLFANWLFLRPSKELTVGKDFAKSELNRLGKMSKHEWVTSAIVLISIAFWVTGSIHKLPAYVIGMLALAAFAGTGIVKEKEFGGAVSWSLLLFLGVVFGLPEVIEQNGVTEWVSQFIIPVVSKVSGHTLALCIVLMFGMLIMRFGDPSGFLTMALFFLPVSTFLKGSTISPMIILAALLYGGHPFWAPYQNFWVALMHGMTDNLSYSSKYRIRLSHVYAITSLIALCFAVAYWRLIGLWS